MARSRLDPTNYHAIGAAPSEGGKAALDRACRAAYAAEEQPFPVAGLAALYEAGLLLYLVLIVMPVSDYVPARSHQSYY